MAPLEYYRPRQLQEAVSLLGRAQPLAGGTTVVPRRRAIQAVMDLQGLELDTLEVQGLSVVMGAMLRLQRIVESGGTVTAALAESCRREAGWNLRNMATLGGAVMAGDGRSPLLTALLALDAQVRLALQGTLSLDDVLNQRREAAARWLITALEFTSPAALLYAQVSRTPADRPILCVAVARPAGEGELGFRLALGGFGARPSRLAQAERALSSGGTPADAAEAARAHCAAADDERASAAYRASVAGVLVSRLLKKVMGPCAYS